jgi:exonuclease VII large subunit
MSTPVTRGELLTALAELDKKFATKADLDLWGGAIVDRLMVNERRIAELDARLTARIDELDARLTARIDELNARLTARIDELDARLTARIDELDARLTARIDELEVRLNKRMDAIEAHLRSVEHHLLGITVSLDAMAKQLAAIAAKQ